MQFEFSKYDNLPPGAMVFGRFRVEQWLGSGSTGVVYACSNTSGQGEGIVALKVLTKEAAADERLVERFRNEIHASYRVSHPNVIRAFETFRNEECDAYTMECAKGGDLETLVRDQGPLSVGGAKQLFQQVCSGLKAVHEAGIIHRDLKPQNILLTVRREAKISDFTTALCADNGVFPEDDGAIGSDGYISPEVLQTGRADQRSDIFGLGGILHFMLTGFSPYDDEGLSAEEQLKNRREVARVDDIFSKCPTDLVQLVGRLLAYKPEKRPQTVAEILQELDSPGAPRRGGFFSRFFA